MIKKIYLSLLLIIITIFPLCSFTSSNRNVTSYNMNVSFEITDYGATYGVTLTNNLALGIDVYLALMVSNSYDNVPFLDLNVAQSTISVRINKYIGSGNSRLIIALNNDDYFFSSFTSQPFLENISLSSFTLLTNNSTTGVISGVINNFEEYIKVGTNVENLPYLDYLDELFMNSTFTVTYASSSNLLTNYSVNYNYSQTVDRYNYRYWPFSTIGLAIEDDLSYISNGMLSWKLNDNSNFYGSLLYVMLVNRIEFLYNNNIVWSYDISSNNIQFQESFVSVDYNGLVNEIRFYTSSNKTDWFENGAGFSLYRSSNTIEQINSVLGSSQFNQGYNSGLIDGQAQGFQQGENVGYDKGYTQGFNDGSNSDLLNTTTNNLFNTLITTPFTFAKEALNFEILGIDIFGIVMGLLTIGIVTFIIKRIF